MKLFTSCTFEGLGSRKNDFLEKLTYTMQSSGLKPMSSEERERVLFRGWRASARAKINLGWRILRELALMQNDIFPIQGNLE
jgi:hypothetical protein